MLGEQLEIFIFLISLGPFPIKLELHYDGNPAKWPSYLCSVISSFIVLNIVAMLLISTGGK